MMAALLGLCLGLGLFLLWWSAWPSTGGPAVRRREDPLQRMLRRAGVERVSTVGFLLSCLAAGLLTGILIFIVSASIPLGCCFLLFGAWLPVALVKWRARRRTSRLREIWPDVVDHLRSAVRAGLSLAEALTQLGDKGPAELREFFTDFGLDYRATSRFDPAIERLKVRLADPVADRLIEAIRLTRDVGGSDVGRLLGTLGEFVREDARTRNELEARQSWTINAARLAVAAPWLVLLLLCTQPQTIAAFNTPGGWLVLGAGLFISVLCYRLMLRIGSLPEEPRVLQ